MTKLVTKVRVELRSGEDVTDEFGGLAVILYINGIEVDHTGIGQYRSDNVAAAETELMEKWGLKYD